MGRRPDPASFLHDAARHSFCPVRVAKGIPRQVITAQIHKVVRKEGQMKAVNLGSFILAGILAGSPDAFSEEPQQVVVSATRVPTSIDRVGSSISVITSEDLENAQIQDVSEALSLVPGVSIARNGGPGQVTTLFLRGAQPGFTRVMIDGVELNDPSGIGTAYDFAHLNVSGIERIEILRGPQSTLYGGDAMAGVINIITRKGEGAPSSYVHAEGGSYGTWRLGAGTQGRTNAFDYAFDLSQHQTDGFSNFDEQDGFSERDGYRNTTLSGRVGMELTELMSLDTVARYTRAESDYDTFDGSYVPTEQGRTENEEAFVRVEGRALLLDGAWDQTLGASRTMHRRDFVDTPGVEDSSFDSDILAVNWQNNLLSDINTFTFGIDWQEDESETSGSASERYDVTGYYLQDTLSPLEHWDTTLGVRIDDHSEFGSETTYRLTTAYLLEELNTKLKGSWGTGFKAPSLFELFADSPFVTGNPNLKPQTSEGWDAGFEQSLFEDQIRFGVTYFDISYEDLIAYRFDSMEAPGTYVNQNEADSSGVEAFIEARPHERINLRLDYTYLDNEDRSGDNVFELRRPKNQVSGTVSYRATDDLSLTLYGVYVGSRLDYGDIELDEYTLLHLAARYDLSDAWECYVRVENLLDEDYQQVASYGTAGIAAYAGVKGTF